MTGGPPSPTPGELTRGACVLEVLAPKAGNVHPQRSFDDTRWTDFVAAADAIEPIFDGVRERRVGETVLSSIRATREATGQNVNLGIVLLLAPLARVPTGADARAGVREILDTLDSDDCRDVFEAIALANPGGLGSSDESDVHEPPPDDLLAAMRLAADRDLVARQYAGGFDEVFQLGLPALQTALDRGLSLQDATVRLHLELMAEHPALTPEILRSLAQAITGPQVRQFEFASSRDPSTKYVVSVSGGDIDCTCPGFQYRGTCRHVLEVKNKLALK